MEKPTQRSDEEIAKSVVWDIMAQVTGCDQWKDYNQTYVVQRILRAIQEARGEVAPPRA